MNEVLRYPRLSPGRDLERLFRFPRPAWTAAAGAGLVALAGREGAELWRARAAGAPQRVRSLPAPARDSEEPLTALAFAEGGQRLYASGYDSLRTWRVEELLRGAPGQSASSEAWALTRLVAGPRGVWGGGEGALVGLDARLAPRRGRVFEGDFGVGFALAPRSGWVATLSAGSAPAWVARPDDEGDLARERGAWGSTITIFAGGERVCVQGQPLPGGGALAVSPDERWLVAAGSDDALLWRVAGRAPALRLERRDRVAFPDQACEACFSPDGRWLLLVGHAQGRLYRLDETRGRLEEVATLPGAQASGCFLAQGRRILTAGSGSQRPRLWRVPE